MRSLLLSRWNNTLPIMGTPLFKVYNNEQIKCIISFRLYDLKIKYQNFIFFENNLNNKSIPEIKHYHVFILLK